MLKTNFVCWATKFSKNHRRQKIEISNFANIRGGKVFVEGRVNGTQPEKSDVFHCEKNYFTLGYLEVSIF